MKPYFNKTTILGVGLIGASFALSMKRHGLSSHIAGWGRTEANLKRAQKKGIIDAYTLDLKKACEDSDLIVIATPPGIFVDIAKKIRPSLKKGAIVIDVGSVKGKLVARMESLMPKGVHFIGCHPIAGSSRSGIDAAQAGLFKGALCIITKTKKTNSSAFKKISGTWRAFGAGVKTMTPLKHDKIYALVSHLPHVLAYALVNTAGGVDKSYLKFCGQGFKDVTRIAGSPAGLWADIIMLNRENILKYINAFGGNLKRLSKYLKEKDSDSIKKEFAKARELREGIG